MSAIRLFAQTALFAFTLAACGGGGGGATPAPVPGPTPPPAVVKTSVAEAARFLDQASFGASPSSLATVQSRTLAETLDAEFAKPASLYSGFVFEDANSNTLCPATGAPAHCFRDHYTLFHLQPQFFARALTGDDQLRQRVAFALSQIMVISGTDIRQPYAMAAFQNILASDAFGNFRTLLGDVTLNPAMGDYLDMVNNDKPNPTRGTTPNENYAREILQLFSIGLVQLNPDGTAKLDGNGQALASYSQDTVEGFAHAFTGWTYAARPGATSKWINPRNYEGQMVPFDAHHDMVAKTLLNGTQLPANQSAATDLNQALDVIFQHPNVGPFIGKQLIQFLVTSNPSPAYVARVTAAFNDNGSGVRGDLKAVVKAILLDDEARGETKAASDYGRLREPVMVLTALLRGAGGSTNSDGYYLEAVANALAQPAYTAPSVFNFYAPSTPLPGSSSLVAPALGIIDGTTAIARANVISKLLAGAIPPDSTVTAATGTAVDSGRFVSVAADATALVALINSSYFHNAMSSGLQTTLTQTVNGIADNATRARAALYLALASPEFAVQK